MTKLLFLLGECEMECENVKRMHSADILAFREWRSGLECLAFYPRHSGDVKRKSKIFKINYKWSLIK